MGGAEAVEVLEFDLGAELLLPDRAEGDVHVAAHLPLFHIAVADVAVLHDLLEAGEVGVGLVGAAHIRLADHFEKRHAGAVVVRPGGAGAVGELGGVLFEVDAGDADVLLRQFRAGEALAGEAQPPGGAERQVVLADLVVFGQVGVEVAFPVELAEFGDGALGEESGPDRFQDRLVVGHGEGSGVAETDRADQGVGFRAVPVGAGTEHLARRPHLDVHFKADNRFVFHLQNVLFRDEWVDENPSSHNVTDRGGFVNRSAGKSADYSVPGR